MAQSSARIDLHTHSNASDGTLSPGEVLVLAQQSGVDVLALTDHDTYFGWTEAESALCQLPGPFSFIRGVEMSCRSASGVSLHILGLLVNPEHAPLSEALELSRDDRIPRMKAIIGKLNDAGITISYQDVEDQLSDGATLGRPHLADALVAQGVVTDRDQAFKDYLHNDSPYYVGHFASDAIEGIKLIKSAGGIAIFAHPGAVKRGAVVSPDFIAEMAAAGLDALEVDHRDHDLPTRHDLRELAGSLNLLVSGSSDFHGSGKLNQIGENLTSPEVWDQLYLRASGAALLTNF